MPRHTGASALRARVFGLRSAAGPKVGGTMMASIARCIVLVAASARANTRRSCAHASDGCPQASIASWRPSSSRVAMTLCLFVIRGWRGRRDERVYRACTDEGRTLVVTMDRDFGNVRRFPPKQTAGRRLGQGEAADPTPGKASPPNVLGLRFA